MDNKRKSVAGLIKQLDEPAVTHREMQRLPVGTCRTIIDALGLQVEPVDMARLVRKANRAYAVGNYDEYHNQCNLIKQVLRGAPTTNK